MPKLTLLATCNDSASFYNPRIITLEGFLCHSTLTNRHTFSHHCLSLQEECLQKEEDRSYQESLFLLSLIPRHHSRSFSLSLLSSFFHTQQYHHYTPLNRRKQITHKDIQQTPIRHKREAQLLHSHHKRLFLAHGELRPIAIHNVELSLKYRNQPLVLPLLESHREIGVGMRQVHRERVVQHVKVRIYASCHRSTATQRADVVHVLNLVASVVDK